MNREKDTVRKWLDAARFDWSAGRIIEQRQGWGDIRFSAHVMAHDDPELDREFDAGYGGDGPTSFVAEDADRIYFVGTYDTATWLSWVWKDLGAYLHGGAKIEQVGG